MSVLVGVISLGYAFYTNRKGKRIEDITRSEAWTLYQSANTAGGEAQEALKMYKEIHKDDLNSELVEKLSKADQLSLTVYHDCIRFIQLSEPTFDLKTIGYWVSTGKISPNHVGNFNKVIVGMPSEKLRCKIFCKK